MHTMILEMRAPALWDLRSQAVRHKVSPDLESPAQARYECMAERVQVLEDRVHSCGMCVCVYVCM
jgi:hypothetical protein